MGTEQQECSFSIKVTTAYQINDTFVFQSVGSVGKVKLVSFFNIS